MSSGSKSCPQCGRLAKHDRCDGEHSAKHTAAHSAGHLHPAGVLIGPGALALSKILPKNYRCKHCGHEFSG